MSLLRQRTKRRQKGVIKQMQVKDVNYGKTVRKSYAKYQEILQMPNLLKIQKDSYDWFLREGLHEVFRDVAAISAVSYTHLTLPTNL